MMAPLYLLTVIPSICLYRLLTSASLGIHEPTQHLANPSKIITFGESLIAI